jgi:hypothetical protein
LVLQGQNQGDESIGSQGVLLFKKNESG